MNERVLSVIVPVYNTAPWLPRCLESLLGQTYRDLEIICVDDGSKDNSADILDEYAARDSRIKVIHQENAGVSAARNAGLAVATGEYVTFVDSDDWVECEGYEAVMACASDDVELIHFGVKLDSWGGEEASNLEDWFNLQLPEGVHEVPSRYWVMNTNVTNKLYKTVLIRKYGVRFPMGVAYAEDLAFHQCFMSVARTVYTIKNKIYHYDYRGDSAIGKLLSGSGNGEEHLLAVKWVADFVARCRDAHIPEDVWYGFFEHMYGQAKRFTSVDKHAVLMDRAWSLASEIGVLKRKHTWLVQELYQHRFGKGIFYRFEHNREIFGLFGKSIFSVTHNRDGGRIYRILGHKIYESRISGE